MIIGVIGLNDENTVRIASDNEDFVKYFLYLNDIKVISSFKVLKAS